MQKKKFKLSSGFTVAELIVVIVVIGILAGISIVSYGAWRHSATAAKVKSDLNNVISAMDSARTFNNTYPSTVPSSVIPSSGVVLSGGSTDGLTYCVDGTSTDDPTVTYYVASETKAQGPLSGTCATRPGYQTPAVPTGLALVSSGYSSLTISWSAVTGATSYTLQCASDSAYVSNVGQAQSTTTSATASSLQPGSAYYCHVQATSGTGVSAWSSTFQTSTAAAWTALSLQSNWYNYGRTMSTAAYTKTTAGMVMLKGLVSNASSITTNNNVIATLPPGYRPSERLIFQTTSANVASRVDVATDGSIVVVVGNPTWVALDGINFMPSSTTFNSLTPLLNGWAIYSSPTWAYPAYMKDSLGRVHVKGLISGGTATNGTAVATLPAGYRPQYFNDIGDDANNGYGGLSFDASGNVIVKGFSNAFQSIQAMFYNSSYPTGTDCLNGWCALTLQNGWVPLGAGYTQPAYTKGSDGVVVVNGLIQSGNVAPGTVIANLPAGFRPKERIIVSTAANQAASRVDVMPNGDIMAVTGVSAAWTSLDPTAFMAEQ